jgi:3-mercaptopyruvate sulfurtransferase SseA
LDTTDAAEPTDFIQNTVPDKDKFAEHLSNLGVDNKHQLVLYDRSPFGFYASTRIWWTLKVIKKMILQYNFKLDCLFIIFYSILVMIKYRF